MIITRLKLYVLLGASAILFAWLIVPTVLVNSKKLDYSREDFSHDIGKIYYDLGLAAQQRNDLQQAIKHLTIAQEHLPNNHDIQVRLTWCQKRLQALERQNKKHHTHL